jgi:hypothetical protein
LKELIANRGKKVTSLPQFLASLMHTLNPLIHSLTHSLTHSPAH